MLSQSRGQRPVVVSCDPFREGPIHAAVGVLSRFRLFGNAAQFILDLLQKPANQFQGFIRRPCRRRSSQSTIELGKPFRNRQNPALSIADLPSAGAHAALQLWSGDDIPSDFPDRRQNAAWPAAESRRRPGILCAGPPIRSGRTSSGHRLKLGRRLPGGFNIPGVSANPRPGIASRRTAGRRIDWGRPTARSDA